jgi:hypothetical protein
MRTADRSASYAIHPLESDRSRSAGGDIALMNSRLALVPQAR